MIHLLSQAASPIRTSQSLPSKPSSFGVYLGALSSPVTENQRSILAQWDAVVLNHCEAGVLDAVNDKDVQMGPHIIARMDLVKILNSMVTDTEVDLLRAVYLVSNVIQQSLRQENQQRYFTGVLVAGWRERVSPHLLNGLAKLIAAHGLDVFLEVGPPDYLDGIENFNLKRFAGIIVRNGTILPDGQRRDFFDMDKMKSTTKAFVSESCMRPFIVMMWETVDDEAELSHAVARRSHMWCNYHGAIPFIARQGALTDVSQIRSCEEPLAAFQWLKNRRVMGIHEKFRTTRVVRVPDMNDLSPSKLTLSL
jgi:hypothetical protein